MSWDDEVMGFGKGTGTGASRLGSSRLAIQPKTKSTPLAAPNQRWPFASTAMKPCLGTVVDTVVMETSWRLAPVCNTTSVTSADDRSMSFRAEFCHQTVILICDNGGDGSGHPGRLPIAESPV